MKTLRITLILALLACTIASLASDRKSLSGERKIVPITFERAIQTPGLAAAMFQQLDPGFLNNNQHYYIVKVSFQGNIYQISGIYHQWVRFFSMKWKFPVEKKKPVKHN